jgi:hypothetical protein
VHVCTVVVVASFYFPTVCFVSFSFRPPSAFLSFPFPVSFSFPCPFSLHPPVIVQSRLVGKFTSDADAHSSKELDIVSFFSSFPFPFPSPFFVISFCSFLPPSPHRTLRTARTAIRRTPPTYSHGSLFIPLVSYLSVFFYFLALSDTPHRHEKILSVGCCLWSNISLFLYRFSPLPLFFPSLMLYFYSFYFNLFVVAPCLPTSNTLRLTKHQPPPPTCQRTILRAQNPPKAVHATPRLTTTRDPRVSFPIEQATARQHKHPSLSPTEQPQIRAKSAARAAVLLT